MSASIDRTNGGMVTTLVDNETTVLLQANKTYDLIHLGIDSGGSTQAGAMAFYSLDNQQVTTDFAAKEQKFYLFQSSATYLNAHRIRGVESLRVIGRTAEGTLMIRPVVQ